MACVTSCGVRDRFSFRSNAAVALTKSACVGGDIENRAGALSFAPARFLDRLC